VNVPLLDLVAQYRAIKDEVLPALQAVIESQQFVMGPPVPQLEIAVARLAGAKHGIACASGTDALLLPLKALGLSPGDEVITTPFTFFATAGTIHNAGGTPVFVDIEPGTFNIDPAAVEAAILQTEGVDDVHDLHVWAITSGREALSAHVIHGESVSQPLLLQELRTKLHDRFGVDHLTIQMETSDFEDDTFHFCHAGTACFRSERQ